MSSGVGDKAPEETSSPTNDTGLGLSRLVIALLGALVTAAAVARFFVGSPLWLDEALSVNIASLDVGDIGSALRQDGHPPLYYWMLHVWMEIFGSGDIAVRALSGTISLATLAVVYRLGSLASRRHGLTLAMVVALSPFAFRYGSEARMYSLVMFEVFVGILLASKLLAERPASAAPRPSWRLLAGIALVTSALLWTHYWTMWLLAAVGLVLVVRLFQNSAAKPLAMRTEVWALAAMALGAVSFLPWLDTLLYQRAHTGTPWAPSFRPATLLYTSLVDFAGGAYSETQLMMLLLVVLATIGAAAGVSRADAIELRFGISDRARMPLYVLVLTTAIASAVGLATGIAFAPRYASIYFPFFAMLVALGLDRFVARHIRTIVFCLFGVFSVLGLGLVFVNDRSQVGVASQAVRSAADAALVVTCPDQLSPATHRAFADDSNYEVVTYPDLRDPKFVDWVDYIERNDTNDPKRFAQQVLELADERPIALVWNDTYLTLEGQCANLINILGGSRSAKLIVTAAPEDFYESVSVTMYTVR